MKYIKDCPQCGKKIRFPLDRGKIKIFCKCGYSAVIDPDDKALYESGSFDLKPDEKADRQTSGLTASISFLMKKFTWPNLIKSLFEVKYKLQNFRYLPDRERNRLIAVIFAVMLVIAAAVYYL